MKVEERRDPLSILLPPLPFCLNWTCGIPPRVCDPQVSLKSLLREQFLKKPNFVLLFAKEQSAGKLSSELGRMGQLYEGNIYTDSKL